LSICRASGKWEVLDICDGDEACSAGLEARLCLNSTDHCLPGTSSCAEDQATLLRCADFSPASQSAWEGGASYVYAHCSAGCGVDANGDAACEPVLSGENDVSDELLCVPGSSSYLSCGLDGCIEAECGSAEVCADSGLGCRSCVPNAFRCEDNRLLRCDALGSGEALIEDCGSGVCDKIRGRCLPAAVGERYCDAGLLRGVGVDGSPQTIENCGAAELCDAQAGCKPAYCVLGSVSCQKDRVFSCADGTSLTPTGHRCDSEDRCEEGLGCAVAARITAGDAHTCALIVSEDAGERATGYVKCWGANESGQLGNGASLLGDELQARPVVSRLNGDSGQVSANFRGTGLCAGRNFTCADITLPSGDAGVGCWGGNDRGQLGIGGKVNAGQASITYSNRIELPVMKPGDATSGVSGDVPFTGLHGVVCGADFACALDENEAAHCWGSNDAGQLGTGQASVSPNPFAMPVANLGSLKRLGAGGRHACGIDAKGRVYCWGDNSKDQLGQGDAVLTDSHAPIAVGVLHADELALGRDFTFALSEGALVSWGQNSFGQLSNGNTTPQSTPSPASGLELPGLSLLVSGPGAGHACAVMNSSLWCWGANPLAELGDGSRLDRYQPVLTIESDARHLPGAAGSIAIGKAHTCALDGDGNIWCWGANQRRQLGRASIAPAAPSPLRVY
jgi:alpha-tubulin suppressor-like RCC1 family protein